ncbi:uncharacterized protein LOC121724629 [Alosa sapidissima]|uniref:uncharacterized protein LOC121724629 n=1 Tax=Alosa sapidissima TaxID=34773 RepID=UPI001C0A1EF0|nr:uncharacterized protein LOC121724629 [Alosa sapidissima]
MLHNEHGGVWWDSLSPAQREECVFELGVLAERALSDRDLLALCELPGAFHIYRQGDCEEEGKLRVQSWSAHPQELAWTALVFLMELESFYQEEKRALSTLMTRVDQAVQCEVCICLHLAVTRAQRETHSHAALLAARQNWETWPDVNTDTRGEHLATLIRQRDKHPENNSTHNLQDFRDNQETQSECPANQSAETSMDPGDRLLMEETPYLEILCDRSQCDVQHGEPIAAEEGQGLEKQGSLIAAAWGDISEPANQDSPPQSPLDQDQEAVSSEEPSEETPDLTHTLLTDAPAAHTLHTHPHTGDPQTLHTHSEPQTLHTLLTDVPAMHTLLHTEDLQSQLSQSEYTPNIHTLQTYTDIGDPQTQHAHLKPQKTHPDRSHTPVMMGEEPEVCVESCAEVDEGVCSVCIDQESVFTDEGSVCEEESVCGEDVCVEGVYETQEGVCPDVEEMCGAAKSVFENRKSVCENHNGVPEKQEGGG